MTFRDTLTEEQKEAERAWEQRILAAERQRIMEELVGPLVEALEESIKRLDVVARLVNGAPTPTDLNDAYNAAYSGVVRAALSTARKAMEEK